MPERTLYRPPPDAARDFSNTPKRTRPTGPPAGHSEPGQTNAENFYYLKQINSRTPMLFVLRDGESVEGVIEWYDKACLRILREDGPALLLYKEAIRYMYKVERRETEERETEERETEEDDEQPQ